MSASSRLLLRLTLALALASTLLLNSCALALYGQQHLSGDNLPQRLPELERGSTREQVVAVVGESSGLLGDSADRLRWAEVIRPRACRMHLLFSIPIGRVARMGRQVEAEFEGGRLVRADVSYFDRRGRLTSIESLLRSVPDSSTPSATPAPNPGPTPPSRR